jgi:hypothetical protein
MANCKIREHFFARVRSWSDGAVRDLPSFFFI